MRSYLYELCHITSNMKPTWITWPMEWAWRISVFYFDSVQHQSAKKHQIPAREFVLKCCFFFIDMRPEINFLFCLQQRRDWSEESGRDAKVKILTLTKWKHFKIYVIYIHSTYQSAYIYSKVISVIVFFLCFFFSLFRTPMKMYCCLEVYWQHWLNYCWQVDVE